MVTGETDILSCRVGVRNFPRGATDTNGSLACRHQKVLAWQYPEASKSFGHGTKRIKFAHSSRSQNGQKLDPEQRCHNVASIN